jgi:hypothetical protein
LFGNKSISYFDMKRYSIFNAYSYFGGGKIKEVSEKG